MFKIVVRLKQTIYTWPLCWAFSLVFHHLFIFYCCISCTESCSCTVDSQVVADPLSDSWSRFRKLRQKARRKSAGLADGGSIIQVKLVDDDKHERYVKGLVDVSRTNVTAIRFFCRKHSRPPTSKFTMMLWRSNFWWSIQGQPYVHQLPPKCIWVKSSVDWPEKANLHRSRKVSSFQWNALHHGDWSFW